MTVIHPQRAGWQMTGASVTSQPERGELGIISLSLPLPSVHHHHHCFLAKLILDIPIHLPCAQVTMNGLEPCGSPVGTKPSDAATVGSRIHQELAKNKVIKAHTKVQVYLTKEQSAQNCCSSQNK